MALPIQAFFCTVILLASVITNAQELPTMLITDVHSGKEVAFDKVFRKGEVTLVSFWATWCIPGKREVKTILKNLAQWQKEAAFNYVAVAVDQQHNEALVKPYIESQQWDFPVYLDAQSELKRALNFNALPFIRIINKEGKVVFTHTGFDDGELIVPKLKEAAH